MRHLEPQIDKIRKEFLHAESTEQMKNTESGKREAASYLQRQTKPIINRPLRRDCKCQESMNCCIYIPETK
jgi:hypothetical protein